MTVLDHRTGRPVRGRPRKFRAQPQALRGMGAASDSLSDTFGGRFFEWMNPDVVQREYDLSAGAGRAPQAPAWTFGDVFDIGVENALDAARGFKKELFSGAKWLLVIGVVAGGIYALHLVNEMQKRKSA